MRRFLPLLLLLLASPPARADYFDPLVALRDEAEASKLVLVGRMENARETPDGPSTDFAVTRVVKGDGKVKDGDVIQLPRFITTGPKDPPEFLVFARVAGGRPDVYRREPLTPALLDYFTGSLKIDAKDRVKLMRYAFPYLEHDEEAIGCDASVTFDQSRDADVREAGRHLDPAKLRLWLQAEPATSVRRNRYARLLACCGDKTDAAFLRKRLDTWVKEEPPGQLDGVLAAYTVLDPKAGWAYTRDLVKDPANNFTLRYSGLRTARYFQTTRPGIVPEDEILGVIALALTHGDMADLPINDLREWRCWALTDQVLGLFGKKGFEQPLVRRAVVRYALRCPDPKATAFVAELRKAEPELVAAAEEWLKEEAKAGADKPRP